jgi:hypothetical protein
MAMLGHKKLIINADFSAFHQSVFIELSYLIVLGAQPSVRTIVSFIFEVNSYTFLIKAPELFFEFIIKLDMPFLPEKCDNFIPTDNKIVSIAPF